MIKNIILNYLIWLEDNLIIILNKYVMFSNYMRIIYCNKNALEVLFFILNKEKIGFK